MLSQNMPINTIIDESTRCDAKVKFNPAEPPNEWTSVRIGAMTIPSSQRSITLPRNAGRFELVSRVQRVVITSP